MEDYKILDQVKNTDFYIGLDSNNTYALIEVSTQELEVGDCIRISYDSKETINLSNNTIIDALVQYDGLDRKKLQETIQRIMLE